MLFSHRVDQGYLALPRLCDGQPQQTHRRSVTRATAAKPTVVFTDIQMPGAMDGLKLARAVRGRWPPIRIIATSGHVRVGETDLPEGGRFLPKPYSPRQVTGVLRELMSGGEI
jgi:CheY-like chemotaxis protein